MTRMSHCLVRLTRRLSGLSSLPSLPSFRNRRAFVPGALGGSATVGSGSGRRFAPMASSRSRCGTLPRVDSSPQYVGGLRCESQMDALSKRRFDIEPVCSVADRLCSERSRVPSMLLRLLPLLSLFAHSPHWAYLRASTDLHGRFSLHQLTSLLTLSV